MSMNHHHDDGGVESAAAASMTTTTNNNIIINVNRGGAKRVPTASSSYRYYTKRLVLGSIITSMLVLAVIPFRIMTTQLVVPPSPPTPMGIGRPKMDTRREEEEVPSSATSSSRNLNETRISMKQPSKIGAGGGPIRPAAPISATGDTTKHQQQRLRENHDSPRNDDNDKNATGITLAQQQIENYKKGVGLLVNLHITHQGGTIFCDIIGRAYGKNSTPPHACMQLKTQKERNAEFMRNRRDKKRPLSTEDPIPNYPEFNYPHGNPWPKDKTFKNIAAVRKLFHMVAWEFEDAPQIPLTNADWENPNMVSVIIMRDPISRLLAKDGYTSHYFPGLWASNATEHLWSSYSKYDRNTNNYALRILSGRRCCAGERTDRDHLETAKKLLQRFTFVLDLDCLDESLSALADVLNIPINKGKLERKKTKRKKHKPNRDRIPYIDVYEYLVQKNKLDIELYEWSKNISLVNCSAL